MSRKEEGSDPALISQDVIFTSPQKMQMSSPLSPPPRAARASLPPLLPSPAPARRSLDAAFLAAPLRDRKAALAHLMPLPLLGSVALCAAAAAAEALGPSVAALQAEQAERAAAAARGEPLAFAEGGATPAELALQAKAAELRSPAGAAQALWRPLLKEVSKESLKRVFEALALRGTGAAAAAAAASSSAQAGALAGAGGGGGGASGVSGEAPAAAPVSPEAHAALLRGARYTRDITLAAVDAERTRAEDDRAQRLARRAPAAAIAVSSLRAGGGGRTASSSSPSSSSSASALEPQLEAVSLFSRAEIAWHVATRVAPRPSLVANASSLLVEAAELIGLSAERYFRRARLEAEEAHKAQLSFGALRRGESGGASAESALRDLAREEDALLPQPGAAPPTPAARLALALALGEAPGGGEAEQRARARVRAARSLLAALAADLRLHADLLRVLMRAAAAVLLESAGAGLGTLLWPGSGTALVATLGNVSAFFAV